MEPWGTHLVTFLVGVITGAGANYFATKYTDKRHDKEETKKEVENFNKVKNQMPELIAEMKQDFTNEKNLSIREFVLLPSDKVIFNSDQPRFSYFETEHQNLKGKIAILENYGYIIDVTPGNAPIYRMTEEFFDLVLKS